MRDESFLEIECCIGRSIGGCVVVSIGLCWRIGFGIGECLMKVVRCDLRLGDVIMIEKW